MSKYSRGAFLHIVEPSPEKWQRAFLRVMDLPQLDHVEVWLEYFPSRSERVLLRDLLRGAQIIVHGPFIHLSLATNIESIGDASLKRCAESIDVASDLGAKVVTFHAGTYAVSESHEAAMERLARRFSKFLSRGSPLVTLENMPVRDGTTKECLGRLEDLERLQTVIPEVRFTFDVGHSIQNGDDYESFLKRNISRIEDIHLHDARPGGRGHLRLGAGMLDLPGFVTILSKLGFDKYVSLETISIEDTEESWAKWIAAEEAESSK